MKLSPAADSSKGHIKIYIKFANLYLFACLYKGKIKCLFIVGEGQRDKSLAITLYHWTVGDIDQKSANPSSKCRNLLNWKFHRPFRIDWGEFSSPGRACNSLRGQILLSSCLNSYTSTLFISVICNLVLGYHDNPCWIFILLPLWLIAPSVTRVKLNILMQL
mgnify:CR=1 FL=1